MRFHDFTHSQVYRKILLSSFLMFPIQTNSKDLTSLVSITVKFTCRNHLMQLMYWIPGGIKFHSIPEIVGQAKTLNS